MSRIGSEFVVATSEVLNEGVTANDDAGGPVGLQAAHWSRALSRPWSHSIRLLHVLLGVVHRVGEQLGDGMRQRCRAIGDDFDRCAVRGERGREELAGGSDVAAPGDKYVDR